MPPAVLAQAYSHNDVAADANVLTTSEDGARDWDGIVAEYAHSVNAAVVLRERRDDDARDVARPYPYFARRQVTSCNSCHVAVPKLNTYGRLVKNTGFELPELDLSGHEEFGIKKFTRYVPLGFRGVVDFANGDPNTVAANLDFRALQLLGGGSLFNNKVSWWLHTHIVEDNEFSNPFNNTPHELWGQYNLSFGDGITRVSVRGGMSELPLWFAPSKTKLSEIPYAVYDAAFEANSFTISKPQFGVIINGAGLDEIGNDLTYSWALAAVSGKGDFSNAEFTQVFGRFTKTYPNISFGTFAFVGRQDILPEMAGDPVVTDRLVRFGVDVDANVGPLNIYATGIYGRNSNPSETAGAAAASYFGGFIGTDVSIAERLVLSARYDGVEFSAVEEVGDGHAHAHEEPAPAHDADHDAGHLHGELVTEDTDAVVIGLNYMMTWQLRLTTEYRGAFSGLEDKWIAGIQFAF
jgi:hypothetical protein